MNNFKRMLLVTAAAVLGGCATVEKMPLQTDTSSVDESKKSILVARVSIKNENNKSHQPKLNHVSMVVGGENYSFTKPTLLSETDGVGKDYLISMSVNPGKAELKSIVFLRQVPMLLMASAFAELNYEIDVPSNKIVYLGNIDAVIVPRTDDSQPRAGSVIPLVDQSVAGFSTGTFKITISDNYDGDMKEFASKFPALSGKQIAKNVLTTKLPDTTASAK